VKVRVKQGQPSVVREHQEFLFDFQSSAPYRTRVASSGAIVYQDRIFLDVDLPEAQLSGVKQVVMSL
jgi:hypothetical protein